MVALLLGMVTAGRSYCVTPFLTATAASDWRLRGVVVAVSPSSFAASPGLKIIGNTTVTIPPSGCGNDRFWKPRTMHPTTLSSGKSEPPLAANDTLPARSMTNFTATRPWRLGFDCSPCW